MDSSTPPSDWTASTEHSYHEISNYHNNVMGIKTSAMTELSTYLNFSQLRFHFSKQQGRTFHVTTGANSTGKAVVQYFSGQTDELPYSCNSFQKMEDDNSQLAVWCHQWGNDGSHHVGKWGHHDRKREDRMYNHAAFIADKFHWHIVRGKWLCDDRSADFLPISPGDFWKIYLR